jgi:hypothetical protein
MCKPFRSLLLFLLFLALTTGLIAEPQLLEEKPTQTQPSQLLSLDATQDIETPPAPGSPNPPLKLEQPTPDSLVIAADASSNDLDEFAAPAITEKPQPAASHHMPSVHKTFQKAFISLKEVMFFGEFEESEKILLQNRFNFLMSRYYKLTTYDTASTRFYETQITESEGLIQLTITFHKEKDQAIEESVCSGCDTEELYIQMNQLIHQAVVHDDSISELYRLNVKKETTVAPVETGSDYRWHITASSIALVGFWQSTSEAQKHNETVNDNEELKSRLSRATSSAEIDRLKSEIDDNDTKIEKHRQNFYLYSMITVGGLCWEGYLVYNDFLSAKQITPEEGAGIRFLPLTNGAQISLTMHF